MKIVITGRKCSPRESFKERAEKKLAKVERFFGGVNRQENRKAYLREHPEDAE